jgi:drug/metabolite transporter (DMT)-like permease
MFSVVVALVGALVFGSADFLGGLAAKRLRSLVVTAVSAFSGFAAMLIVALVTAPRWNLADIAWGAGSGLVSIAAIALLYGCLAIGPMSILSPLTAVISAIAPMLWGLLVKGESLSAFGYAGLAAALAATVLVGFVPGGKVVRPRMRGILMAVGSGVAIGAFIIIMSQTHASSGVVPLVVNRAVNGLITSCIVLGSVVITTRRGRTAVSALAAGGPQLGATPSGRADLEHAVEFPQPAPLLASAWWMAVACGAADATANALMLLAMRSGDLSIVSALTAMYPGGTILLAAIVLRERIAPVQWLGLALAITAGILFALT